MRTLTVFCPLGLSNRLRVLLSAGALAEASGRELRVLWPLTAACAAPFERLFTVPWPVATVPAGAVAGLPYRSAWFDEVPDLLRAPERDVVIGHSGWLIRPDRFTGHDALAARCRTLFPLLQPVAPVQEAVADFTRARFRPAMIGVHLRRGDLRRERPDAAGNTPAALRAIDGFLSRWPEAGILLCTDDGAVDQDTGRTHTDDVRGRLHARYGDRVVSTTPRSLDRRMPEAIQDALVDLWLLRRTDAVVGTTGSSFSAFAVYGRNAPHLMVSGATRVYRPIERLARVTGLHAGLSRLGRRAFGRELPFPALARYYLAAPYRWTSRALHRAAPALHEAVRKRLRAHRR